MAGGPRKQNSASDRVSGNAKSATEDKSTFVLIQVFLCAPGILEKNGPVWKNREPQHPRNQMSWSPFVAMARMSRFCSFAGLSGRYSRGTLEQIFQFVIVTSIQPADRGGLLGELQLAPNITVLGTAVRLDRKPTVSP